jgi:hypothetical protein
MLHHHRDEIQALSSGSRAHSMFGEFTPFEVSPPRRIYVNYVHPISPLHSLFL